MKLLFFSSLSIICLAFLGGFEKNKGVELEKGGPLGRSTNRSDSSQLSKRIILRKSQSRRLWELPLIRKGLVVGVEHTYYNFIVRMNLNEEETNYFKSILNGRALMTGTSQLKWAKASLDTKTTLSATLQRDLVKNTAQIRQFLNHEGDFQLFIRYESELPERQALSPFLDALALNPRLEDHLFELLQQARFITEKTFGYEFESPTFLRENKDLELLKTLRAETDRKIKSTLPGILDSKKSEEFLNFWADIREIQEENSALTAKYIREEDS